MGENVTNILTLIGCITILCSVLGLIGFSIETIERLRTVERWQRDYELLNTRKKK